MHRQPVTVLGLGVMGRALAAAFVAAGHPTTVWNRTPGRAADLVGVDVAPTVGAAVAASPLVVVCLLDDGAVAATLDEHDELAGRTVVNLTTGTPDQARTRAAAVADLGADYLDGGLMAVPPMIGGEQALVLTSGSSTARDAALGTLAALGRVHHVGDDPGRAALYDVALLSAMYGLYGGALHAFGLVRAAGVDASDLMPLLDPWLRAMTSSVGAIAAEIDSEIDSEIDAGPEHDRPARSPLAMQSVGFTTLLATTRDLGVREDLLAPVGSLLAEAVAEGDGDRDIAALISRLPSRQP